MPAIESGKVLVSGANGYIAVWVVKTLLDRGFTVRGTVRAESKGAHLRTLFADAGDKLELVVVEDITVPGAFDAAVQGVDAILHTASPFHFHADDPAELITPAVAGTTGILASAAAHAGPRLQRVVVTSSCAAVLTPGDASGRAFAEADWNEASVRAVEAAGRAAPPAEKYRASKTLAERAAWAAHAALLGAGAVDWDLVVLNPPFVFGPVLHEVRDAVGLNESARDWYESVVKGAKTTEQLATVGSSYVDVRDLALAHVLALQKQDAAGQRIIVSAGPFNWQNWVTIAHKLYPEIQEGDTSYDPEKATYAIRYVPDKERELLKTPFRSMEETTKDILDDFKAKGWL
ncbi:NAD(P)-binding protein [Epithele typhae]|uniref:NAD(P)-binding protein n=1 Tax=Epithele typhae TaxID=378194 RepID=UPI002007AB7C|nr:NAD(P)-binding protein [Epithele typhae]KAH9918743.1 NAD(P)-binding protein [Epithele typhae]